MNNSVVAYDQNRVIGKENDLPWEHHQKDDLRRFMQLTLGQAVVMGGNTFRSLPDMQPLRDRQNIVLSKTTLERDGFQVARTLEEAYAMARHDVYVIGGGQIYELALPSIDRIYATEIATEIEGGDTKFPVLHINEWHEEERQDFPANERNMYGYSFVTYLRNHPID